MTVNKDQTRCSRTYIETQSLILYRHQVPEYSFHLYELPPPQDPTLSMSSLLQPYLYDCKESITTSFHSLQIIRSFLVLFIVSGLQNTLLPFFSSLKKVIIENFCFQRTDNNNHPNHNNNLPTLFLLNYILECMNQFKAHSNLQKIYNSTIAKCNGQLIIQKKIAPCTDV